MTDKPIFSIQPVPANVPPFSMHVLIATWFGAGCLRPAPGTFGSLAAIPFGYTIAAIFGPSGLLIAAILLFVVGMIAAERYGKDSGVKDDQSIVVDEVVGLWIAAIPAGTTFSLWILALILFRLFDIWKPWPVSFFDKRTEGGFGVMMDDVVAGVYALLGVAVAALMTLI